MKRRLSLKFFFGYIVTIVIGFLFIAVAGSHVLDNLMTNQAINNMRNGCNLVLSSYRTQTAGSIQELSFLNAQLKAISSFQECDIWIIDQTNQVVTSAYTIQPAPTEIPEFDPTAGGDRSYLVGDFYGQYSEPVITVYTALTRSFQTYGYVISHCKVSTIIERREAILKVAYITWIGMSILSAILILFFRIFVMAPLKKIIKAASEYAAGNLSYETGIHSHDEMGYLSDTLSYMSGRLNSIGEDQKRFVANVSHDFRSPLTSIKGYIEAILDGTIPPELQDKYLKIVLNETNRLTNLTQSLLTLNNFDANGILLDCSHFDINDVIRKILATFERRCQEKKICFEFTVPSKEMFVYADMGKIQQVLYNLIDNAIKFSNPDSIIAITVTTHHEKVFISVKDNGIGIPKENLPKIWERFYKTDTSRGKDKKGTGLGLSIVKEILQAHNENIDVISTPGVGTEFVFSLPVSRTTSAPSL